MSIFSVDPFAAPQGEPVSKRTRRIRVPRPRVPRPRTRQEGGVCGNCGFEDTGHYCSRCGEPLHGTEESVMEILWSDLVEGPLHNLFALGKTTWLMLAHPHRFFHGVLRRQRALSTFPFFLAPAWSRVSHKPHGVPNAVKYFVLIYTLSFVASWAFGVNVRLELPLQIFGEGAELPDTFSEPLFLAFIVFSAWMYAAAVSKLLGGRIETEILTRFMLYLNGFALIPFVGMAVAGVEHLGVFLVFMAFWLYALFVLPQLALPRLFGISRMRLGMAQAGAAVANIVMIFVAIFCAGVAADYFGQLKPRGGAASTASAPFDPATSGFTAVKLVTENTVFPVDTLLGLLRPEWMARRGILGRSPAPFQRQAPAASAGSAGGRLFPMDTVGAGVHFQLDYGAAREEHPRRGLRGDRSR